MLPTIAAYARLAFRHHNPEARQEAVEECLANALVAYVRLVQLGKVSLAYPTVLARYAVAQVNDGRKVGGHLNVQEVLSPYCQRRKKITVERLDHFDEEENAWQEAVVQDTRTASVPDIVAFRCDFTDWLASLPRRDRRIAQSLAIGHGTSDVAKRFDVSAGRISQLRRELAKSWRAFIDEAPENAESAPAPA
jgi:transposase-like protein